MTDVAPRVKRKFSYYNYAKVMSYNGTMNHCVGGRGIGKTYGAKKKVTRDALKAIKWTETPVVTTKRGIEYENVTVSGESFHQFIYVRRYKEELVLAKQTFFADYESEFPNWDFKVDGWKALASPIKYAGMTKGRPWVTIGFFVPLSIATSFKSVAFPHVRWIIFDEYILEKGPTHYLTNEATAFKNFYSTVDRYQDKTRVLFLANSVSITNPHFLDHNIVPEDADENGILRKDFLGERDYLIVHFIDSDQFEGEVYNTKFGKYIQGTDYADYAVGNQFSDNHKHLIGRKGPKAYYMFTIESDKGIFSVWFDAYQDKYFCQEARPNGDEKIITLSHHLMAENKTLMTRTDQTISVLRRAFNHDRVRFDTPVSRNAFVEIFK